jgi:hypothetical protein
MGVSCSDGDRTATWAPARAKPKKFEPARLTALIFASTYPIERWLLCLERK